MVISVGIDVSKDKHDCFIVSSEGEVQADAFTIPNTMEGFHFLLQKIRESIMQTIRFFQREGMVCFVVQFASGKQNRNLTSAEEFPLNTFCVSGSTDTLQRKNSPIRKNRFAGRLTAMAGTLPPHERHILLSFLWKMPISRIP